MKTPKFFWMAAFAAAILTSCTSSDTTQNGSTDVTNNTTTQNARTIPTPTYGTGKHTLVQFADFQCISCIQAEQTVVPIFEEYADAGQLTIEYRQFPLTQIHPNAMGDALAVLCAADQDAFMDYKKSLYALESEKRNASSKTVTNDERIDLAKNLGLDVDTFSQCLTNGDFRGQIEADIAFGRSLNIQGTPTFILNGVQINMSQFSDVESFRSFLDQILTQ